MRWAAFGTVMAAGSYALLFPPTASVLSGLNFAALLLLSALAFAAPVSRVAARLLDRALGAALLPSIFASAACSVLVEAAVTGSAPDLTVRAHEALTAAALSFIAAQCANLTRRESLRRVTA